MTFCFKTRKSDSFKKLARKLERKMTESYSKSKLKRKKSSAEEFRSETFSWGAKRSSLTSSSGDGGANTAGAAPPPAAPWWRTLQPPAVESLWALALMNLENQLWDPVPGLPLPPAEKPSEPNPDGEQWGDLGCEVAPLPEFCTKTPPSPDSPSRASSQQDLLVQTKPGPDPPDRSPNHLTASPPLQQQQGEEAAAATSRELKVSAQPLPADEEEEVGRDEELQSCPMCLQAFLAGSSQMDRDGHLAQCLSEMNVDMTW